MPAPILQFKRGNAGVAGTVPALRPGEPAISLNNFDFFIGIDTSVANNKFFGSHRYWAREDGTTSLRLKLVDRNGVNSINLKTPDTVSGITTYTLPETPINTYLLKTDANGVLSWSNSLPAGTVLSGITTFTDTTDNTLGNSNTGSVQIDGGLGVDKNVTIGGNLNVQGYSELVGVVTFRGGTINLGDSNTDNINVGGEFISNLTPNDDNTYDIGIGTQRWRHTIFSGIGTFGTGVISDAVQIGITAANEIDTSSGNLILDSAGGTIDIQDNVTITGDIAINGGDATTSSATFNLINANATTVNAFGAGTDVVLSSATGITTVRNKLTVGGNLEVDGNNIQASDGATNITLSSSTLTTFAGDIRVNGNDIQASDGNTNITLTSNTLTTFAGDIRVNGNDIQSSSGANVLTLSSNNATFANDLTVSGNLYVNGSTTQVNTAQVTVEDRTIELGMVDGSAPSTSTTWDLGVLFNYFTDSAKKSALVWEHTAGRFQLGSVVSDGGGTGNSNPQITVSTFAPIEVAELWVNNTCTGGAQQVIGCIGSELNLQNIVIDAGTF